MCIRLPHNICILLKCATEKWMDVLRKRHSTVGFHNTTVLIPCFSSRKLQARREHSGAKDAHIKYEIRKRHSGPAGTPFDFFSFRVLCRVCVHAKIRSKGSKGKEFWRGRVKGKVKYGALPLPFTFLPYLAELCRTSSLEKSQLKKPGLEGHLSVANFQSG